MGNVSKDKEVNTSSSMEYFRHSASLYIFLKQVGIVLLFLAFLALDFVVKSLQFLLYLVLSRDRFDRVNHHILWAIDQCATIRKRIQVYVDWQQDEESETVNNMTDADVSLNTRKIN